MIMATTFQVGIFTSFCSEKQLSLNLTTCSAEELNDIICKFYGVLWSLEDENREKLGEKQLLVCEVSTQRTSPFFLSAITYLCVCDYSN